MAGHHPWSKIVRKMPPEQRAELERRTDEILTQPEPQAYSLGDAAMHDMLQTLVIEVEKILCELGELRSENAQLLEKVSTLEMLVDERELQPM